MQAVSLAEKGTTCTSTVMHTQVFTEFRTKMSDLM